MNTKPNKQWRGKSNLVRLVLGICLAGFMSAGCQRPPAEKAHSASVTAALLRVQRQPNTPDSWNVLGQAYMQEKMYNDAYIAFKRAWTMNQRSAAALRGLAEASLMLSNPQVGMDWIKQALAEDPRAGAAWGLRGRLKFAQGDTAGAFADLEHAGKLGPLSMNDCLTLTNIYLAQKKNSQAVAQAEETVRRFPLEAQAHHNYAVLLERLGRANDAEDELRLALTCDPKLLKDKLLLAQLLVRENRNLDEARSLALEVATKDPGDGTAAGVAARALYLKGKKQAGLRELLQVQSQFHDNAIVLYWIYQEASEAGEKQTAHAAASMLRQLMGGRAAAPPDKE